MNLYENHNLENSEIPIIYHENFTLIKDLSFGRTNWHKNIELLQTTEGCGLITSDSERIYTKLGELAVINANHLHSFSAESKKFSYRCLIIDRSFCISNGFDSSFLEFDNHFVDENISSLMEELSHEWSLPTSSPYRTLKIRAIVLQIMKHLCLEHSTPRDFEHTDSKISSSIKQAIDFISTNYEKDISLDDVADHVGLNKYYFSHEFRKITGMTFVTYLNKSRCEMSKRLLITNKISISEVAQSCGFNSRSYFAKTFKKQFGILPSEYRQTKTSRDAK